MERFQKESSRNKEEEDDKKPKGLERIKRKDPNDMDEVSPRLLQSCVTLGTKMLMEQRIRKTILKLQTWVQRQQETWNQTLKRRLKQPTNGSHAIQVEEDVLPAPVKLSIEWTPLSVFDLHSHFILSFGTVWSMDATILQDEITITRYQGNGSTGDAAETTTEEQDNANDDNTNDNTSYDYRKVKFHSDQEFEIFTKMELKRCLKQLLGETLEEWNRQLGLLEPKAVAAPTAATVEPSPAATTPTTTTPPPTTTDPSTTPPPPHGRLYILKKRE